ncbi:unnamed protein product [Rotaria sordida]|uniref:Dynamin N-terminal domain-containing protein n=1 Tax=Rotaria sordida TaxID=392033 RepID=A0A815NAK0_9BILA|nr:unnamed protein product [Rotaria sordida]CAF3842797.1 unnamed protein product [Rotaria sordida]
MDHAELSRIIHSNHHIRQIVQRSTNNFLSLQNDLFQKLVNEKFDPTVEQKSKPLIDTLKIRSLSEQITADRVQLALIGENSCGKTSLIHLLLGSSPILPSDVGSVSARIIRLTYATNEEACLNVYESINKRDQNPCEHISLKDCFTETGPDWNAVKLKIKLHVERPDPETVSVESTAFQEWAKYFVEICIPSDFLKLGIDLYDTPGLLYSDPLILKQNLHNLVKLIRPTMVFMYENSAVQIDTQDCFLALKEALGKQLDDVSIFFLNTKVDIGLMIPDDIEITEEEFETTKLVEARTERKELLLKVPSMAQEIKAGSEFDIIAVESEWDLLGAKMNHLTVNHLIQFVANADLIVAKNITKLIQPIIDSFFEFAFVANHRTHDRLKELHSNALQWVENYFLEHQNYIDQALRELYDVIIRKLNEKMDSIVRRAADKGNAASIEKYIRTLVQYEIIRDDVDEFVKFYACKSLLRVVLDESLLNNADTNEFLVSTQQSVFTQLLDTDDETTCQLFLFNTLLTSFILIGDILIETDEEDDQPKPKQKKSQLNQLKTRLRQCVIKKTNWSKQMGLKDIAQQYLNNIRAGLISQKNLLNQIIEELLEVKKNELRQKIEQQCQIAKKFIPQRERAYDLANQYAEHFACVECKLIVAYNLKNFNGHIPKLNTTEPIIFDENNNYCEFYSAEWLDKKDLIVKKFKTNISNLQYLESHYHRKVTQLNSSCFLSLSYLYEHEENELWMIFPKYECIEKNIESLAIQNIFKIIFTVAICLEKMHANELVHGNIDVKNIFCKEGEKYLLGDFYLKQTYDTLLDFVHRHSINKTLTAVTDDIYSLGQLGLFLYEKSKVNHNEDDLKAFKPLKTLLEDCSNEDRLNRPKISNVVRKINDLMPTK